MRSWEFQTRKKGKKKRDDGWEEETGSDFRAPFVGGKAAFLRLGAGKLAIRPG